MSKIYFQGAFGAYSHLAALSIDSNAEILPCKTFDDCFNKASDEPESKIIIPDQIIVLELMVAVLVETAYFPLLEFLFWY